MPDTLDVNAALAEIATTKDHTQRNRLAMDILNAEAPGLDRAVADAIEQDPCPRDFGTPLYALNETGGRLPLGLVVKLFEHGSFEARAEAGVLLDERRYTGDLDDVKQAKARLGAVIAQGQERAEHAAWALAVLND